jgi:hypothetical protein
MYQLTWKRTACAAVLLVSTCLAACGNTYSRDDFTKGVIGKTEQEVASQYGKPQSVDDSNPDHVVWTYTRETFDLANQNRIDSKTIVIFEGAAGSRHVAKVDFS